MNSSSAHPRPPHDVFPAGRAGHLDGRLRRLLYRPGRLAARYVRPGDRVPCTAGWKRGMHNLFFTRQENVLERQIPE